MNTEERRSLIEAALKASDHPITASYLAKECSVSRQIIVGDVAILRASGLDILATPRGYIVNKQESENKDFIAMIACRHLTSQLREELYTIVDFGATVLDVSIEHSVYGELSGKLNLSSRYDVDMFIEKMNKEKNSAPISSLTDGTHLHRIKCADIKTLQLIKDALRKLNILVD